MTQTELIKSNNAYRWSYSFEFASKNAQKVELPETIHLVPIGSWEHAMYGPILITSSDIKEFMQNFNAKVRNGVYITAGHEGFEELPAQGWISSLEERPDGLWGKVDWTELGKATLSDKQYKFFSPEFYRDYEDPQTHQLYRNVLIGGALTKSPYFKELEPVVFSEQKIKKQFNENQNNNMNLAELLAKDIATLTDDEKAFIKANAAELTEEQKVSHAAIIAEAEVPATETPAEETPATETPAEETPAAEVPATEETPAPATETPSETPAEETPAPEVPAEEDPTKVNASEKVLISASELSVLKQSHAELKKTKLDAAVGALVFSASNAKGRFLPKTSDNLRAFMETLNDGQLSKFNALIAEMPANAELFTEIGNGGSDTPGTAKAAIDAKIAALKAENPKMSHSDALKKVLASDKGLADSYAQEVKA